jgi:hypothetical protein
VGDSSPLTLTKTHNEKRKTRGREGKERERREKASELVVIVRNAAGCAVFDPLFGRRGGALKGKGGERAT